ncbi:hypothetical protein ES708_17615 [subsurface metagenome]
MPKKAKPFVRELFGAALTVPGEMSEGYSKELREKALEQLTALPGIPKETKELLAKQLTTDPFTAMGVLMAAGMAVGYMTINATLSPFFTLLNYQFSKLANQYRLDPSSVSQLWLRGFPKGQDAIEWKNLSSTEKAAKTAELEGDVEKWFGELSDQGFGGDEQEAVKELARYMPSPDIIMLWAAREVFEPELREKYQLDKFLPPQFLEWAAKVGITGEVALNYWASHWQLPSLTAIQELWRRQIIDKEVVDDFWTELDMVPWVREDLFKLFRAVPTRVDIRRWWDMRTISETRLKDIYMAQGYWEEDLDDYVTWTKVYTDFPDLIARYSKGWITLNDVRQQLYKDYDIPYTAGRTEEEWLTAYEAGRLAEKEARIEELIQTKVKAVQEERIADTTALTRSLIIRGAKADPPKLTRAETIELLMLKNYDKWEAEYIYDIEVTGAASPETPTEFRQLVESYRHAVGLDFKEVPPELLAADRKRSELRLKLAQARSKDAPEVAQLEAELEIAEVTFQNMKTGYGL